MTHERGEGGLGAREEEAISGGAELDAALFADLHQLLRDRAGLAPHEALAIVLSAIEALTGSLNDDRGALIEELIEASPAIDRVLAALVITRLEESHIAEMKDELLGPALLHFIPPELRRGLGIFLTPEPLARALGRGFTLTGGARVLDPACGAGVLLRPIAERAEEEGAAIELIGGDINEAILKLASLNLGRGFRALRADALGRDEARVQAGSIDLLISNPPFGVLLDPSEPGLERFKIARAARSRLPFELLFIERALELLSPLGRAALILPRSVLTNSSFEFARELLDELAIPEALISLPAETFAEAGAGVTPIALFLRRRQKKEPGPEQIPHARIDNIGRDRAGRFIEGSELESLGVALEALFSRGELKRPFERLLLDADSPLSSLARALSKPSESGVPLSELVSLAGTGKTPSRAAYQPSGAFILKVGNLTDEGIDFTPRERNFVKGDGLRERLLLSPGDLLLTSTAHHPKYIAEKVDLFEGAPSLGEPVTFVGELMRLRPNQERIDPVALLAILRHPETRRRIRERIHGQTAHLRPRDLLEVRVDESLATKERVAAIREELALAQKRNALRLKMRALYSS